MALDLGEGLGAENYPQRRRGAVPTLRVKFPRRVSALHQIEITSRCTLRCPYCPQSRMAAGHEGFRKTEDMTRSTFERCLQWADRFVKAGTQMEINLAGIGESTAHPEFVDFVRMAREAFPTIKLTLATNGVGYDRSLVEAVAPYRPAVWVSLHRPDKGGRAIQWWGEAGLLEAISTDPATNANDWAGQVEWFSDTRTVLPCMWLRSGRVMALSDGRLTTCCLDATGAGVVGHVADEIGKVRVEPYSLCGGCHQEIGVKGYNQRDGVSPERLKAIG